MRCRARRVQTAGWMVAIGLCGVTFAQGVFAHSERATISLKTYTAITVDGKLDDWIRRLEQSNWSGRLEVKKGQVLQWVRAVPTHLNTTTGRVEAGTISSQEDLSVVFYTLWDDRMFYVAASVVDDQVVTQHEGEDIWQDDAIELWLDCRHDAVTHTLFQDDEYQLGFSPASRARPKALGWAWRNPHPEPVRQAMQVASASTGNGYIIEGAVPWGVLRGCRPAFGTFIGFNISIVDKDADQLWTHLTWAGMLHSDPSQFGHLYFEDAPIDLFPSDVFEGRVEPAPWDALLEPANGT